MRGGLNVDTIEIRHCVSAALVGRLNGPTAPERARGLIDTHNKALDDLLRGHPYPETRRAEYWYATVVVPTFQEPIKERGDRR